jgi:hypothetical protein
MMRIAASIVPLLLAAACSRTPTAGDAPGTYVLHLRNASDTLWVQPGGRYVHRHAADGAEPVAGTGTWEFGEVAEGPAVLFSGVPSGTPSLLATRGDTGDPWPALIQRTATGTVVLMPGGDVGTRYHRISTRMLGSGRSLEAKERSTVEGRRKGGARG